MTLTVANAQGQVVRTLTGTNTAGVNRVYWDLRYEPTMEVRLRTSPMYAPHIIAPAEGRVAPGTGRLSILAPPGTYTVTLNAGGQSPSQTVEVRKDPNSGGTEGDITAQTAMLTQIARDLNDGADAVHRIESMRVQLEGIGRAVEDAQVRRMTTELQTKLIDLEMNLVDLRQTGGGQDGVRFGSKLLSKLNYLTGGVSASDFKPTDQATEVRTILNTQLRDHLNALDLLISRDLQAFNDLLKSRNIPNIVVRPRSGVS